MASVNNYPPEMELSDAEIAYLDYWFIEEPDCGDLPVEN